MGSHRRPRVVRCRPIRTTTSWKVRCQVVFWTKKWVVWMPIQALLLPSLFLRSSRLESAKNLVQADISFCKDSLTWLAQSVTVAISRLSMSRRHRWAGPKHWSPSCTSSSSGSKRSPKPWCTSKSFLSSNGRVNCQPSIEAIWMLTSSSTSVTRTNIQMPWVT